MPELAQVAQACAALARLRAEAPLTLALCWHRPKPRTSQHRAAQAALTPGAQSVLITGGNRSSKTTLGAMLAVAWALGRDHPHVQAWAALNRLDVRAIPKGPGAVCASALTASDSRSVQRAKVAEFLPADHRWLNRDGNGEARCIFPHGGYILFKSNDAGSRRFQGDAWDLFWADEEHDQAVYNEARMRLVDRGGRSLLTMTPLKGLTWVWARFLDKPEARTASYALHSEDNPHIPQEYLAALLASYGDHERAARSKGEFTTLEGRVYGGWARHLHLVEPFDVPEDWTRYGSIDFGTRNPFAYLHAAHDHSDDTIHITGMRYQAERTMSQHAEALRALWSRLGEPSWIVADPEDKGSRLALAREHGMSTLKARKSIRPGISAVAERLALDAQGKPHLLIHNTPELAPLIREIEGYVWDAKNSKADQPDKPLKKDDHAMDALRYLCMQVARSAVFAVG